MRIFLFILFSCYVFSINAEDLDFIFEQPVSQLSMSHMRNKARLTDSTSSELVDYGQRNKIFSHKVREAIFRFGANKILRSADITVIATVKEYEREQVQRVANDLKMDLERYLKQKGSASKLVLPNMRVINVMCWETESIRIFLWHSDPKNKKSQNSSFLVLRWELKSYPIRKYFSWYAAAIPPYALIDKNDDKIVIVPHRKQSDITGKCAPTIVSCQMAQCGSEIPPVILRSFWDDVGEERAMDQIGSLLFMKYTSTEFNSKDPAKNSLIAIEEYNKLAQKYNVSPIRYEKKGKNYFWDDNFSDTDNKLWEKLKKPDFKGYRDFRQYVISNINQNIPVSWSLKRHNARGRHRRMIIGYNLKKNIVYYYDTWGNSRNIRNMPFRAAFVMTIWSEKIVYRR